MQTTQPKAYHQWQSPSVLSKCKHHSGWMQSPYSSWNHRSTTSARIRKYESQSNKTIIWACLQKASTNLLHKQSWMLFCHVHAMHKALRKMQRRSWRGPPPSRVLHIYTEVKISSYKQHSKLHIVRNKIRCVVTHSSLQELGGILREGIPGLLKCQGG
jgi:hypothetical protein